jgi:hypothetical protein
VTKQYAGDSVCRWLIEGSGHYRSTNEFIKAQIAEKLATGNIFIIEENTLFAKQNSAVTNITVR